MTAEVPDNPHIVIHGAGSVGCLIGGTWMLSGLPVSFYGRQSVRDEIAENGLTVTDSERRRIEARPDEVDFSTDAKVLARGDIIALCVKSTGTEQAAKEIARHARKGAVVISFQNGVSNVDLLKAALPDQSILWGMVPFNVARMGNGRWHKGTAGALWAEDHPVTRALEARIGKGPGALRLSGDMRGVAWGKLLINLNNAINALSGRPLLEQLSERDYRRVFAACQVEALEILEAAGIEPVQIGPISPKLLPHVIASPDLMFRNTDIEDAEDRRRRALVHGRRFRRRAADRDRLSERRSGQARRVTGAARAGQREDRRSGQAGRSRASSGNGRQRSCAATSSRAAPSPASDTEPRFFV